MNAFEFIEGLKQIAPKEDFLKKEGLDAFEIEKFIKRYYLKEHDGTSRYLNPIIDLVKRYKVENFDIGMVHLNSDQKIEETEDYLVFGAFDADHMAIDKRTDEIVVLSREEGNEVLWYCSKTASLFLKSLLLSGKFNELKAADENLYENQEAIHKKAEEIAVVAGGEKYLKFYFAILGYDG